MCQVCLSGAVARMNKNIMTIVWFNILKYVFTPAVVANMKITRYNDLADVFPWLDQPMN